MCAEHLAVAALATRERTKRLKKAKLCTACGKPAIKNRTLCRDHLSKNAQNLKRYRKDRFESGLCLWCDNKRTPGSIGCKDCTPTRTGACGRCGKKFSMRTPVSASPYCGKCKLDKCKDCGGQKHGKNYDRCDTCARRSRRNGDCTKCGTALMKGIRAKYKTIQTHCPRCEPNPAYIPDLPFCQIPR